MIKNFFVIIFGLTISLLLIEIAGNIFNLKPGKWSRYYEYNSTYGWYTWSGADHLYGKHAEQTNGYKTRGKKPSKNKKIILLGDSAVETSHKLEEMPEKYLEDHLPDYSVISFGSWGWGNDQQLLHLKNNIKSIKPEIIVLWWITNDLSDNMVKQGFGGPKPTFKIKNNKLVYPNVDMGDAYLPAKFYRFYTYRLLNKFYQLSKQKFKNNDNFDFESKETVKCNQNTNYVSYPDLLKNIFNEEVYDNTKRTLGNKPRPYDRDVEVFLDNKDEWINEQINKTNKNFELNFSDELFWNRNIITKFEKKKIKTANLLIKEMQKISIENNSKFIVFFPIIHQNRFYSIQKDELVKICFRGIELEYSNKNADKKLELIFDGIENIYITNNMPKFGDNFEDMFDGHLNNDANNYQMKELSERLIKLGF